MPTLPTMGRRNRRHHRVLPKGVFSCNRYACSSQHSPLRHSVRSPNLPAPHRARTSAINGGIPASRAGARRSCSNTTRYSWIFSCTRPMAGRSGTPPLSIIRRKAAGRSSPATSTWRRAPGSALSGTRQRSPREKSARCSSMQAAPTSQRSRTRSMASSFPRRCSASSGPMKTSPATTTAASSTIRATAQIRRTMAMSRSSGQRTSRSTSGSWTPTLSGRVIDRW